MVTIYHNPRCMKSRQTLALLTEKGEEITVIDYLKNPPSAEELKGIIAMLRINAKQLVRTGEAIYKEQYKGKNLSEEEWIQAMISHPKLIERPLVIKNKKAAIGRPPEQVLTVL